MGDNPGVKKSPAATFQIVVLTAMLILLPLGSWYYLQIGFNYNKDMMAQLKNYGEVPDFSLYNQDGELMGREAVKGKLTVLGFFSGNSNYKDSLLHEIRSIHEQFNEREDVVFVLHHIDSLGPAGLSALADAYQLKDREQIFLLSGNPDQIQQLMKTYGLPLLPLAADTAAYQLDHSPQTKITDYPFLIFADTSGVIKNYYPIDSGKSLFRLVEHLAIKLPREKEEKPVLVRDTEK